MHDLPLLINISVALAVAFAGGLIARRIGMPTIVGYLLAGIVIGPFTPGFVGDTATIQQLAELGVIFLLFGVGLQFSFGDLWRVRDIAVPGALIRASLTTLMGYGLGQLWGWPPAAGIVLGLAISVASTVVLLRGLMDHSLLNTSHGQVAVGWVVMEDILSVLILVLMPTLASNDNGFDWRSLGVTVLKEAAFAAIMIIVGRRLLPWLLDRISYYRSRELFILAILVIVLGVATGAAEVFGVSLALGAFVAGAIISQSHLSHQVGADVLPFREAFQVLFFVSVGMLVNPLFLWQNIGHVAALTLVVVFGRTVVTLLIGLLFPRPARTFLVVAVGLAQIGEFSFIIGQGGMALGLLDSDQYSLILAASLLSITLNPLMYRLMPRTEKWLRRLPVFWKRLDQNIPLPPPLEEDLKDHVVIIGYGRVGKHLVDVLDELKVSKLVIEADAERIGELNEREVATLYGDAANSEVITHAGLPRARELIVTIPDENAAALVVTSARAIHPDLPIIVRASTEEGVHHLARMGANHIVHPELEGSLEMVHHALLQLGFPLREVHQYAESVRRDRYDVVIDSDAEHRSLHDLLTAFEGIEISWMQLDDDSPLVGQTLAEANLRSHTGASVVAVIRDNHLTANPKSGLMYEAGDRVGIIGEEAQIDLARRLVLGEEPLEA